MLKHTINWSRFAIMMMGTLVFCGLVGHGLLALINMFAPKADQAIVMAGLAFLGAIIGGSSYIITMPWWKPPVFSDHEESETT